MSGNLAPIVSEGEINISESDVRKWLYDIHRPLNNSEILGLISIIEDLSSYDTYAYKQKDGTKLNVVKTFEGIKYRIKSNLTADYYYLFAAKSDSDISEFIKEVISNNFPYATHSLSQTVNCFRKASKYDFMNSGLNTVFLIGINSDWSSAVIPVGLVLVDVSAPSIITENDHLFRTHSSLTSNHGVKQYKPISSNSNIFPKHYLSYKKYNLEILDQNESATSGTVYLSTEPFNGNFPKFKIEFSGDVKRIKFKGDWINLSDQQSPYYYSCFMYLTLGKNRIPVTVEDYVGNSYSTTFEISSFYIKFFHMQMFTYFKLCIKSS